MELSLHLVLLQGKTQVFHDKVIFRALYIPLPWFPPSRAPFQFLELITSLCLLAYFKTHSLCDFLNLCNIASIRERNLSLEP